MSAASTLVGLDFPPAGLNLELKPYVVTRVTTDRLLTSPVSNDFGSDIGGDARYSITPRWGSPAQPTIGVCGVGCNDR